ILEVQNILFDFLEFAGTRGAFTECPGGSSGGDSRGCRAVSEWSLGLGHAAQPEASGEISLGTRVRSAFGASGRIFPKVHSGTLVAFGKHSEDGRGVYRIGSRRELWDAWRLGGLPEVVYCLGTRNGWQVRVASGGSYLPGVLGDKCRVRKALGGWSESLSGRVSA